MKQFLWIMMIGLIFLGACSSDNKKDGTITISAAASLTEVLHEISETFNEKYPEIQIEYNFGGSGALKQQILLGAPVDIFFSASKNHFQHITDEGFIDEKLSVELLKNELVLIGPKGEDSITSFNDLSHVEKIAIGNPESVPAGAYSMEVFEKLKMKETLTDALIFTEDVRAVLTYVETGNVDAGLVYRTDVIGSEDVDIIEAAPAKSHAPIIYPVGVLQASDQKELAKVFYDYLQSETSIEIFEEYGFDAY